MLPRDDAAGARDMLRVAAVRRPAEPELPERRWPNRRGPAWAADMSSNERHKGQHRERQRSTHTDMRGGGGTLCDFAVTADVRDGYGRQGGGLAAQPSLAYALDISLWLCLCDSCGTDQETAARTAPGCERSDTSNPLLTRSGCSTCTARPTAGTPPPPPCPPAPGSKP
jgi:hypothetical protein